MKNNVEILKNFRSSKVLICERNKGMIAPLSMKIIDFDDILMQPGVVSSWEYGGKTHYRFWLKSFYIVESDNTFTNINRKLVSLLKAGLLEVAEKNMLKLAQL